MQVSSPFSTAGVAFVSPNGSTAYSLNDETVDRVVTRTSPGAYVLGHFKNNKFIFEYVGRSGNDLNDRLKDHVDDYRYFMFEYYSTQRAAFERQCQLWHHWGGQEGLLDNKNHPQRPKEENWTCPECNFFNSQDNEKLNETVDQMKV